MEFGSACYMLVCRVQSVTFFTYLEPNPHCIKPHSTTVIVEMTPIRPSCLLVAEVKATVSIYIYVYIYICIHIICIYVCVCMYVYMFLERYVIHVNVLLG